MRKYKILVLTDHGGHSKENSIYAIVNELLKHHQCDTIHLASRAAKENNSFFYNFDEEELYGTLVTHPISYSATGVAFTLGKKKLSIKTFDLVLMRLPRPVSDLFLSWLQSIFDEAIIINKPLGIIETSNKKFLLNFPQLCPPMKLCQQVNDILEFSKQHDLILKPLKEYGGKGILKISGKTLDDGHQIFHTQDYLEKSRNYIESRGYLAMKYLKNVTQGDKRILVVGGRIMASSLRLPKEGSWLCNVAQGGTSITSQVTSEEQNIVVTLSPVLLEKGILIYGADTLVNDDGTRSLSEVNTLSIGGFPQAEKQTGLPILYTTICEIMNYANEYYI